MCPKSLCYDMHRYIVTFLNCTFNFLFWNVEKQYKIQECNFLFQLYINNTFNCIDFSYFDNFTFPVDLLTWLSSFYVIFLRYISLDFTCFLSTEYKNLISVWAELSDQNWLFLHHNKSNTKNKRIKIHQWIFGDNFWKEILFMNIHSIFFSEELFQAQSALPAFFKPYSVSMSNALH